MASDRTYSALKWKPITPSDTANVEPTPSAVFVGGAGTVVAIGEDGVSATFTAAAGSVLPIQPIRITAASTATGLIGLIN